MARMHRTIQKDHHNPDNHNGMITHLEPDILECEVKWALESITMNKASGCDGIPVELFQILKDDAVKVLYSICQQIWKTQQWPQDWKRSVFIPIPKKGNPKECSNPPPRVTEIKTKVNKWDLIKLKSFCTAKESINKVTRQLPKWEKKIANKTTDKGLISKIHKQLIHLNARKTNNSIKKWGKDLNRLFLQRRHTDG